MPTKMVFPVGHHAIANQILRCLTSLVRRETVYKTWNGRWHVECISRRRNVKRTVGRDWEIIDEGRKSFREVLRSRNERKGIKATDEEDIKLQMRPCGNDEAKTRTSFVARCSRG